MLPKISCSASFSQPPRTSPKAAGRRCAPWHRLASLSWLGLGVAAGLLMLTGGPVQGQSGGIIGTGAPAGAPLGAPNLGVVGTVTDFGSVIVNKLRIEVRPDQLRVGKEQRSLKRGERVLIKAFRNEQGLQAVELRALPKVEGQLKRQGADLTLLGKRLVGALEGPSKTQVEAQLARLQPGQWVSVDAIQVGDQDLLLGSITVIPAPAVISTTGILALAPGSHRFQVGGQPIVLSKKATRGMPFIRTDLLGRVVRVEGKMRLDGLLEVISFTPDPVANALKQDQPLTVELEGSYQRQGNALVISSDIARMQVAAAAYPKVTADAGPALISAQLLPSGFLQINDVRPWQPAVKPSPPPPPPAPLQGYWYFDGYYWHFMPVVTPGNMPGNMPGIMPGATPSTMSLPQSR